MDEKKEDDNNNDDETPTSSSSLHCDSSHVPTRLAVDRDWIVKLLRKYSSSSFSSSHNHVNNTTTTISSSIVRNNHMNHHDSTLFHNNNHNHDHNDNDDNNNDQWPTRYPMDYHEHQDKEEEDILRNKALVVAPMVDQSDLPFRLLCRNYGATMAFTPMIHAKLFCHSMKYRTKFFNLTMGTPPEDRPLIAQICGSDIPTVLQTAKYLEPYVDGIDINCGCPQQIAKRGQYGAFLLEQEEMLLSLIHHLVQAISIPISVKVRLLPTGVSDSLRLYQRLVHAGIHLLTIHGRNRFQKGTLTGPADWDAIRQAVELLGHQIPIFANGSIANMDDVRNCLRHTKADGIMSSEAILEYPALFYHHHHHPLSSLSQPSSSLCLSQPSYHQMTPLTLAREYLELAKKYPPEKGGQGSGIKCIRMHLNKILHADLKEHVDWRRLVVDLETIEELEQVLNQIQNHYDQQHSCNDDDDDHDSMDHDESTRLSWYMRHRIETTTTTSKTSKVRQLDDDDDDGESSRYDSGVDDDDRPLTTQRTDLLSSEDDGEIMFSMFGDGW